MHSDFRSGSQWKVIQIRMCWHVYSKLVSCARVDVHGNNLFTEELEFWESH